MVNLNELFEKYANSPESKIRNRIWMYKNNFNICDGNFNDLKDFYDKINNPSFITNLNQRLDQINHFELINLDMLRRISNYLSSAFSLVDFSREYMRKNYSGTDIFDEYNKQIREFFIENNLCKFIQDLRNFFLHNGINGFSFNLNSNYPISNDITFTTLLQKKELNKGNYFTSKSKEYIDSLPCEIDIFSEIQKYHEIVLSFYSWLFKYLNEVHKEEINISKQYEKAYFDEVVHLWNNCQK